MPNWLGSGGVEPLASTMRWLATRPGPPGAPPPNSGCSGAPDMTRFGCCCCGGCGCGCPASTSCRMHTRVRQQSAHAQLSQAALGSLSRMQAAARTTTALQQPKEIEACSTELRGHHKRLHRGSNLSIVLTCGTGRSPPVKLEDTPPGLPVASECCHWSPPCSGGSTQHSSP